MKNKNPIRLWVVISLALLLVIIILVFGYQSFRASEAATFKEFNQRQLVLAKAAAGGIELYFETLAADIIALGGLPEVQHLDEAPTRREMQHSFVKLELLGVNDIGILDRDGILIYNVSAPEIEGTDFSWRRYFQEARDASLSDPYIVEFIEFKGVDIGQKGVLVAVPMFDITEDDHNSPPAGIFSGVVLCTLRLDTVSRRFIDPIHSSSRGHAFLIDDDYDVLWSRDGALFGRNLLEETEEFPAFQNVVIEMTAGRSGTGEYTYYELDETDSQYDRDEREEKLVAYTPIHLGRELWSVGVWAPKEEAQKLIRTVYQNQLLGMGLGILAIIIGAAYLLVTSFQFTGFLEREVETKTGEVVRLREAVEASGEVIFMTNLVGIFTYINPEFTNLYGHIREEVVSKVTPRILKSGMMKPEDYKLFWETLLNKQIIKGEIINKTKGGNLVTIEGSANAILDINGKIVGFLAIQRDVTARKMVDEEIKQRNKELAALNSIAATVSQSLSLNQIINDALDEVLKLEVVGEGTQGMLFLTNGTTGRLTLAAHRRVPENHPCLVSPPQLGECLCGLAAQKGEVIISDNVLEDERHSRRWPEMPLHKDICLPMKVRGEVLGVMDVRLPAVYEIADSDIKLLKSVADQVGLAIENARLRESRERAIVEERERIARELHDGLAQVLVYVNTKTSAVRLMLENQQSEAAIRNLLQLESTAQSALDDLREAILGLRIAGDVNKGLVSMIENYVTQFIRLSGVPVEVTFSPGVEDISLPIDTQLHLLRITQEALTNARKHASASLIEIGMEIQNGQILELTIADDGKGFAQSQIRSEGQFKFGVKVMQERAERIGAEFNIESTLGEGTRIEVKIIF